LLKTFICIENNAQATAVEIIANNGPSSYFRQSQLDESIAGPSMKSNVVINTPSQQHHPMNGNVTTVEVNH